MSTDIVKVHEGNVKSPLSIRELTTLLISHYGLHEGKYDILVEFQIGTGPIGTDPENRLPAAIIGISKVGLRAATSTSPSSIDASEVNPAIKPKPSKKVKSTTES